MTVVKMSQQCHLVALASKHVSHLAAFSPCGRRTHAAQAGVSPQSVPGKPSCGLTWPRTLESFSFLKTALCIYVCFIELTHLSVQSGDF